MKELDLLTLLAVFQEMLGPLLWLLLALAIVGTVAFAALLLREKGMAPRRMLRAQALGLIGGGLALALMAALSSSGFTDAGGPADWLLIALVFAVGAIGSAIVLYTAAGCWRAWREPAARPL